MKQRFAITIRDADGAAIFAAAVDAPGPGTTWAELLGLASEKTADAVAEDGYTLRIMAVPHYVHPAEPRGGPADGGAKLTMLRVGRTDSGFGFTRSVTGPFRGTYPTAIQAIRAGLEDMGLSSDAVNLSALRGVRQEAEGTGFAPYLYSIADIRAALFKDPMPVPDVLASNLETGETVIEAGGVVFRTDPAGRHVVAAAADVAEIRWLSDSELVRVMRAVRGG